MKQHSVALVAAFLSLFAPFVGATPAKACSCASATVADPATGASAVDDAADDGCCCCCEAPADAGSGDPAPTDRPVAGSHSDRCGCEVRAPGDPVPTPVTSPSNDREVTVAAPSRFAAPALPFPEAPAAQTAARPPPRPPTPLTVLFCSFLC